MSGGDLAALYGTCSARDRDVDYTQTTAREIETWITRKPQTVAAQELLEFVHLLNGVQTHDEAQLWIRAFIDWYRRHEPFINEKTVDVESGRWWFTHKMLHRSVSHIKRAIPDLVFIYAVP